MIVYHGSKEMFDIFDYSKIGLNGTSEGKGFYFSDNKEIAMRYGENGYLYTINFKGEKPLNCEKITIKKSELKKYLLELNKLIGYLENWGEVEGSGLNNVLNDAVEGELDYSDNDVDLISGICNASGNIKTCLTLLYSLFGYDSIVIKDAEWGGDQKIYIALTNDILEIKDVIKL